MLTNLINFDKPQIMVLLTEIATCMLAINIFMLSPLLNNDASLSANAVTPIVTYGDWSADSLANVLTRTLYAEAAGEGYSGIEAVASVIYNRAGGKPDRMGSVCLKKYQFSCWNALSANERTPIGYIVKEAKNDASWKICEEIADRLMSGSFTSTIGSSNSYYNPSKCNPKWGEYMTDVVIVGAHKFGYLPEHDGFRKERTGTVPNK